MSDLVQRIEQATKEMYELFPMVDNNEFKGLIEKSLKQPESREFFPRLNELIAENKSDAVIMGQCLMACEWICMAKDQLVILGIRQWYNRSLLITPKGEEALQYLIDQNILTKVEISEEITIDPEMIDMVEGDLQHFFKNANPYKVYYGIRKDISDLALEHDIVVTAHHVMLNRNGNLTAILDMCDFQLPESLFS